MWRAIASTNRQRIATHGSQQANYCITKRPVPTTIPSTSPAAYFRARPYEPALRREQAEHTPGHKLRRPGYDYFPIIHAGSHCDHYYYLHYL